jgi:hypothetical protein
VPPRGLEYSVTMSRTTTSYELGRAAQVCAHTGDPLQPGDPIVVALAEHETDDAFDRFDYSRAAWDAGARPPRLFAWWSAEVPEPGHKPGPLVDSGALGGLFDSLADAEDPRRLAFRHMIALMLIRKRELVHAGSRPGAGDEPSVLLVRRKGEDAGAEPIEVVEPPKDPELLRAVTEQLAEIVSVGP